MIIPGTSLANHGSGVSAAGIACRDPDDRLLHWFATIICMLLVALPLAPIGAQAILSRPLYAADGQWTVANFTRLFNLPQTSSLIVNTSAFCAISIAFAMAFGVLLAIAVGRVNLPGARIVLPLLLWPIFISPQIIAFGAIISYGPSGYLTLLVRNSLGIAQPWNLYSLGGMAVVAGIAMTPMTILYSLTAAQRQDSSQEAAARVCGSGPFRILMRITLPMMRPSIAFATVMNVVTSLEMLAIPLVLGGPVRIQLLTTFIYDLGFESGSPDYGLVSAAAVILGGIVGILIALQSRLLRQASRFVTLSGKASRPAPLEFGPMRWVALALVCSYILLTIGTIIGGVLLRSVTVVLTPLISPLRVLTTDHFATIVTNPEYFRSITNTLLIAAVVSTTGTVLISLFAFIANRSQFKFARQLDWLAQLPRVLPGVTVGLGVFYASIYVPVLGPLRNSIWLLVLAYLVRFLPVGYGIIAPSLLQVSKDFDQAARVSGAPWRIIIWRIGVPIARPAIFSCFILLLILSIKEYSSAVFLSAPGSEVIGSTMLTLWLRGQIGPVAALSVFQVAITTTILVATHRLLGLKLHG